MPAAKRHHLLAALLCACGLASMGCGCHYSTTTGTCTITRLGSSTTTTGISFTADGAS